MAHFNTLVTEADSLVSSQRIPEHYDYDSVVPVAVAVAVVVTTVELIQLKREMTKVRMYKFFNN